MTGLAAVTLFVEFICWAHHEKRLAGWVTSWNQDRQENINNLRHVDDTTLTTESKEETRETFDEGEGREWKSWLKTKY